MLSQFHYMNKMTYLNLSSKQYCEQCTGDRICLRNVKTLKTLNINCIKKNIQWMSVLKQKNPHTLNLIIISTWLQLRSVNLFLNKYQIFVKSMAQIGLVVLYRERFWKFNNVYCSIPHWHFPFGKFEFWPTTKQGGAGLTLRTFA